MATRAVAPAALPKQLEHRVSTVERPSLRSRLAHLTRRPLPAGALRRVLGRRAERLELPAQLIGGLPVAARAGLVPSPDERLDPREDLGRRSRVPRLLEEPEHAAEREELAHADQERAARSLAPVRRLAIGVKRRRHLE